MYQWHDGPRSAIWPDRRLTRIKAPEFLCGRFARVPMECSDVNRSLRIAGVALLLTAVWATSAIAQQQAAKRGRQIVDAKCARCHAIGRTGTSPLALAPPFRVLSQKYPLRNLEEALAEGIVTGHSDMPVFRFTPAEIDAILTYLSSISTP